jgi:hypothetical protein
MKIIKIIAYIIITIFIIGAGIKIYKWISKPNAAINTVSPDSTFKSADKTTLRPQSIPFESKTKPIVREPNNVPQKDIARTYQIIKQDSSFTIAVVGAVVGNPVLLSFSAMIATEIMYGIVYWAEVSASDVVKVHASVLNGAAGGNPPSRTYYVTVIKNQ